jgi:gliding motility-associated lipoprotein GldD
LGGTIYLSYKEIKGQNTLVKLLEDSYQMSHYHTKRADYINEPEFHTPNGVHGLYYDVGGNAASAFQFYATDSVKHFIRGALYFVTTPNAASLKPVNEFLRADIVHLVESLKWTK